MINFLMVTLLGGLKANDNITMKGCMRYKNRILLSSTGLSCLYAVTIIWYGVNLIYGIYRLYKIHNINNNQINSNSIKEGLDNLPSGICFLDKYGKVVLCNRKMHELGRRLIGSNVQNLMELENALNNPPNDIKLKRTSKDESGEMQLTMQYNSADNSAEAIYGENIYIFSENEIWIFAKEELAIKCNEKYSQILATNVTEIYKSMIQLDADNEKLKEDAKANRLTVEVTKDIVNDESLYRKNAICYYNIRIRNNGKQPDKNIIEGGGLSNIRQKLEEAGGYMKIQSIPELIINIGLKTSDMGNA